MSKIVFTIDSEEELPLGTWNYLINRRDNFRCVKCGNKEGILTHHIISKYLGGKNTLSNGETLCPHHHPKLRHHKSNYYRQKHIKLFRELYPNEKLPPMDKAGRYRLAKC